VIGTLVGARLKAGISRTQSQRRANGKVVAQVQKARLIVEEINSAFSHERNNAGPEQSWPGYQSMYEIAERQSRIWDTINKAEEVVADNLLQLSDKFAKEYWKFYRRLLIPNPDAIPKAERYSDAESVFREYEPKLTRLARGERLTWFVYMGTAWRGLRSAPSALHTGRTSHQTG
jgi:hypothetical protein